MKICQIGTGAHSIGHDSITAVELVINNLSIELAKLGHDVHILDIYDAGMRREKNLKYHFLKMPSFVQDVYKPGSIMHVAKKLIFSIKSTFCLYKLNKKERFDVVHIQNQYPGFFILLFKKFIKNVCFVYTSHIPFWTLNKREFRRFYFKTFLERVCMQKADKVVAVGYSQKEGILEKIDDLKKVEVVKNGVDIEKFSPGKSKLPKKRIFVLSVARINPIKNQLIIVRAIPEIVKKEKNIKFLFLGQLEDDEYVDKIVQFVNDSDIGEYVEFLGPVKNDLLPEYYRLADIFASSSYSEGFSLSVLEAMASGCAVLLSDIKPHKEIAKDKEIIYFDPNSVEDFIKKFKFILQNKERFKKLTLKTAKNNFSWRRATLEYVRAYNETISDKKN